MEYLFIIVLEISYILEYSIFSKSTQLIFECLAFDVSYGRFPLKWGKSVAGISWLFSFFYRKSPEGSKYGGAFEQFQVGWGSFIVILKTP